MKIGLVGLGNAGRTLHLPALKGLPGITVVAADGDAARRDEASRAFGVSVCSSLSELLTGHHPDVVVIATPPASHLALCREALEGGAHVICEKPFTPSAAEAEEVIAAAAAAGRRVALNHEFRVMPMFRAVKGRIGSAEAGNLVFAQAWQNMDLPPWKEPGWRGRLLTGVLFEAGLHLVDYLLFLFGERPVAVTAAMSSCGTRPEQSDAVALVTLEFSRGRLAQVIQNRLCPGETQYFEVRADTERASLRASFGGRARVSAGMYRSTRPHLRLELGASGMAWLETGHSRRTIASNPRDPAMDATRRLLAATFEAFRTGGAPPATAEDGRDGLLVLAAAYRSAATGARVSLSEAAAELRSFSMGAAVA